MGKLHLLRHAQSRHNAYDLLEIDTDLSEHGIEQAKNVDCSQTFDVVVCSPLKRCQRTLELSGIQYKNLIIEPLAREWVQSVSDCLEGETDDNEPKKNLYKRIKELRLKLLDLLQTNDSVLLVCHYWVIISLIAMDKNGEFTRRVNYFYPNNAEIIQFDLQ